MTNVDTQQPAGATPIWTGMIAKTLVMALSDARGMLGLETIVSRRAERAQHRAPASSKVPARLITSGKLRNLGLVEIAAPLWRGQDYYDELGRGTYERDGGGVLLMQAIHSIDLALSMAGPVSAVRATTTVFVKGVVRRFHAASLISGTLISFSGLSQTGPVGCQFRVLPDHLCGFCARAVA